MLAPIGGCVPRPFRLSPDGQAALLPYRREEYPLDSPLKDEALNAWEKNHVERSISH